jgi:hypothetical protein
VSAASVEPLRSHVQAVLAHNEPTNISELQAFLGTVNFYRRFLPAAARILKPLTDLLIGGLKGRSRSAWPTHSEQLLWQPRTHWWRPRAWLTLPKVSSSTSWWMLQLITSAALSSNGDGRQTLGSRSGFFSKKLDSAQVKYTAFDTELMACFQAIRHFRFMLEGRQFTLFTDHKPLTTAVRWSNSQAVPPAVVYCRVHERYSAHCRLRQRGS